MKLIKITNGIYGFKVREAVVEAKTANDAPFLVTDEEGARLVEIGVAKYVNEANEEVEPVQPELSEGEIDAIKAEEASDPDLKIRYSENMKLDDLKKIAIDAGVTKAKVKKMRTKKEVIEVIETAVAKTAKTETAPQLIPADFE